MKIKGAFFLWLSIWMLMLTACSKRTDKQVFHSMKDMENAKIGVILGSSGDFYITDHFPNAEVLRYETTADQMIAMDTKKVDFVVVDKIQYLALHSEKQQYEVFMDSLISEPLAMAFGKESEDLVLHYNQFLKELKESGELERILHKWATQGENAPMPDLSAIPRNGKVLKAAATGTWELFDFMREGKNVGLDIEITERFAAYVGRPVEYLNVTYSSMVPALMSGMCEMLGCSMEVTEEKKKQVLYPDPYYLTDVCILIREENSPSQQGSKQTQGKALLNDGSDIATASIGVLTGSTSELYVSRNFPEADIRCFDDIATGIAALSAHKLQYIFTSHTTAVCAARKHKGLYVIPTAYTDDSSHIALPQNADPELLQKINTCIKDMRENGVLQDMENRWIHSTEEEYEWPVLPENHYEKVLRVGTSADREPMIFIHNGEITGFDWELINRIAYELQMRVEFVDMKFSGMIAALATDRIDAIVSNFSYTPERAKQVTFTDAYFFNPQKFMTTSLLPAQINRPPFFERFKNSFYSNIIAEKRYLLIVEGLWHTLLIALFALLFGTLLGACICAMRMSRWKWLSKCAVVYINFMRGIPVLVLLMILFYVIFARSDLSADTVAVLTFGFNFAAYVSEIFRTAIQGVSSGQREASHALGFNGLQTFRYIIYPQAARVAFPVYEGEMISLIKTTSIVGYIAVMDLTKASDVIRSRTFDAFFPLILIAIIYFVLAWLFTKGLKLMMGRKVVGK